MKNIFSPLRVVLLLSVVALLPSCTQLDWIKSKLGMTKNEAASSEAGDSKAIATANGKPFMTAQEFEKKYNTFIQGHPLGAMIAQMQGIKRKIFEGLLAQKLITNYVVEKGLDKSPEYLDQLDQMKQMLNVRFFEKENPVKVTETELKAFYEENKDKMPEATVSQGGVKTTSVVFDKEVDAKAFLEKAKGKGAELEKLAKDAGFGSKFADLKLVSKFSVGVDAGVKDKILAFTKFPTLELVKGSDNKFYVVYAGAKEEPKRRSFEELKPLIEQKLTAQKQEESNNKALEILKNASKIWIDESYFEEADKANQPAEQLDQVMPADQEAQK